MVLDSLLESQRQHIIKFMQKHQHFAKGNKMKLSVQGQKTFRKLWSRLTQELNSLQPDEKKQKTCVQYQNLWTKARREAKASKVSHLKAKSRTGNIQEVPPLDKYVDEISLIYRGFAQKSFIKSDVGWDKEINTYNPIPQEIIDQLNEMKIKQKQRLIEFFEENNDLLIKKHRFRDAEWVQLVAELNQIKDGDGKGNVDRFEPFEKKSIHDWHKAWNSVFKRARDKVNNGQEIKDSLEKRVVQLCYIADDLSTETTKSRKGLKGRGTHKRSVEKKPAYSKNVVNRKKNIQTSRKTADFKKENKRRKLQADDYQPSTSGSGSDDDDDQLSNTSSEDDDIVVSSAENRHPKRKHNSRLMDSIGRVKNKIRDESFIDEDPISKPNKALMNISKNSFVDNSMTTDSTRIKMNPKVQNKISLSPMDNEYYEDYPKKEDIFDSANALPFDEENNSPPPFDFELSSAKGSSEKTCPSSASGFNKPPLPFASGAPSKSPLLSGRVFNEPPPWSSSTLSKPSLSSTNDFKKAVQLSASDSSKLLPFGTKEINISEFKSTAERVEFTPFLSDQTEGLQIFIILTKV